MQVIIEYVLNLSEKFIPCKKLFVFESYNLPLLFCVYQNKEAVVRIVGSLDVYKRICPFYNKSYVGKFGITFFYW